MPYGVCHGQRARTILSRQHFSQFTLRALRDRPQRHENNINILPPAAANRPITRPVFATERQTLARVWIGWTTFTRSKLRSIAEFRGKNIETGRWKMSV